MSSVEVAKPTAQMKEKLDEFPEDLVVRAVEKSKELGDQS